MENLKVIKKERVRYNNRMTNVYEVRALVDNSWVFQGQFTGATKAEALEKYYMSAEE